MMVYFVNGFLLWSLCVAQFSDVSQPVSFQTAKLGDSATVKCRIKSEMTKRVWYKFTTGKRLQLVAAFDLFYNRSIFGDDFRHNYSVEFDKFNSHLTISATTWEDIGTYFCGVIHLSHIKFGSGTFLMVKGAKMISHSVAQQPESETVQPGGSVTLSCSVHTSHCTAEHTGVMWLKNSDRSPPEVIYSSGYENGICQRTERRDTTCVYNLPMRNLSADDAGTYRCVVTSCGRILFGNGTRINVHNTKPAELSPTVIALMVSNLILGTVTLILTWTLCKSRRKHSTEATDVSSEGNQISDAVTYAAVCVAPRTLPPGQATVKYSGDSVVYSDIKYCPRNREVWECSEDED